MHTDVRDPYKTQVQLNLFFFSAQRSGNDNDVNTTKLLPYAEPCVQRQLIQSLTSFFEESKLTEEVFDEIKKVTKCELLCLHGHKMVSAMKIVS